MVRTGGMPTQLLREIFELFADGKPLGVGEWWEPAKDTTGFVHRAILKYLQLKLRAMMLAWVFSANLAQVL